jgi:PucR C-terminal helix-turn-helix domain/GGDEF-like domain
VNDAGLRAPASLQEIRTELVARLRERATEMEETIFAHVRALSDKTETEDVELMAGLRAAVAAGLEFGLSSIEHGEEWAGPIPAAATAQARRSARHGARLDTVLRRYAAGDRMIGEFIMDEADRFPAQALRQVLRTQGPQVDRLMAAVSAEYVRELERMHRSPAQRMAERVQRLLDGYGPAGALDYPMDAWHVGFILLGPDGGQPARALAAAIGSQSLIVPRGEGVVWAWIGSGSRPPSLDLERLRSLGVPESISVAVGEPRWGLDGWRLTHREALAAFDVMVRKPQQLTRGGDTILLAAVIRDEALAQSLRETYLSPLDEHGHSEVLRETLRAYFAAGFNAATTAAALGVDRHTVHRRLRKVEQALGRVLHASHAELAVALTLEELGGNTNP